MEELGGTSTPEVADDRLPPGVDQPTANLVSQWVQRIRASHDKYHKRPFRRMEDARQLATWGADKDWYESRYVANIIGQHVQSQTSSLYARNPVCVVTPKQMLDYRVWDGDPEMLMQAQQALMPQPGLPPSMMDPMQAMEILQDYQEGNLRKQLRAGVARTIQLAVQSTWDLEFKMNLKHATRRALTCGVAYIKASIFRTTTRNPDIMAAISDTRTQIAALESMMQEAQADDRAQSLDEHDAKLEELRRAMAVLEEQAAMNETVEQEGILYSFPGSDSLVIDPRCVSIVNFHGAQWIAEQIPNMTRKAIMESYGIDVSVRDKTGIAGTHGDPRTHNNEMTNRRAAAGTATMLDEPGANDEQVIAVWEVWHRPTRTVFTICDGYEGYLEEPHAPPTYTKRFWPWVAIAFNAQDLPEGQMFPPSDVMLLRDPQEDINNARQGLREHRRASRPIFAAAPGVTDEEITSVHQLPAFTIMRLKNFPSGAKISDLLQELPKSPIDPAIYDTAAHVKDIEIVGGGTQAHLGAVAGSTATENAIAAESRDQTVGESKDALDDALSILAEMVSQMMLDAFDLETIINMVGPGAVWPELSRREIADQFTVKIRAGSSGRPNKAMGVANMERIMPFLLQVPGIKPEWLAQTMIERLEEDIDLQEATAPGMPSIATINQIDKMAAEPAEAGLEPEPNEQEPEFDDARDDPNARSFQRVTPGPQPAFDSSGNLP